MPDLERLRNALPQILGAAGGLTGSPASQGFAQRWAELEEMDRRRQQQAAQQQIQQEQIGFQRDANTRAQSADQRAQQDQLLQTVGSVRQFLGDESIETPEAYAQREQMILGLAPRLGLDAGFVQSLRPAPSVYQQRAVRKKLKDIEGQYTAAQRAMFEADDEAGAAPTFPVPGFDKPLTIAQMRELAGTQAVTATGRPMSMRPPAQGGTRTEFEEYFISEYLPAVLEERTAAGMTAPLTRVEVRDLKLKARQGWEAAGRRPYTGTRPSATATRTQESRLDERVAYLLRNPKAATAGEWERLAQQYGRLGVDFEARRDSLRVRVARERRGGDGLDALVDDALGPEPSSPTTRPAVNPNVPAASSAPLRPGVTYRFVNGRLVPK